MPGREDYEERREARIDRLRAAEARANAASSEAFRRSHDLVKDIPLGQPNIAGRPALPNLRAKSARAMDHALKESEKANYYAGRAEAAENNTAISSDNPAAIEKLEEKIAWLEAEQRRMKEANAYYRKHKTLVGCQHFSEDDARRKDEQLAQVRQEIRKPYQSFELTSVNQRIKAAKTRIEKLRTVDDMPEETIEFDGGTIESDATLNRVLIRFDGRPDDAMKDKLKGYGFHWSPKEVAWMRLREPRSLRLAKMICGVA